MHADEQDNFARHSQHFRRIFHFEIHYTLFIIIAWQLWPPKNDTFSAACWALW